MNVFDLALIFAILAAVISAVCLVISIYSFCYISKKADFVLDEYFKNHGIGEVESNADCRKDTD